MKVGDRHFLKFAGAEPARQMRREQLKDQNAYAAGQIYEKPLDSPDRPSNMDKAAQSRPIPDVDNPSMILSRVDSSPPAASESQVTTTVQQLPENSAGTQTVASESEADAPEKDAGRVIQEKA